MGVAIGKTSSQRMSSANGVTGERRMRHVSPRVPGVTMGKASRGTTDPAIYRATARAMTGREDPMGPRIGTRSCRPHKLGQVENTSEPWVLNVLSLHITAMAGPPSMHARPLGPPIHLPTHPDEPKGAFSRGATGFSTAGATVIARAETNGRHIGRQHCRLHMVR